MGYKNNRDNSLFNGKLDAKKAYHAIVGNREINGDVIRDLWQYRQEKVKYIGVVKVDFYFWRKVRDYWDAYLSELDKLIIDSVGSLATKEPVLSLKGWC